ncbi:MAG: DUF302 domain-containing protein [Candidatus Saliniplasma sp.]
MSVVLKIDPSAFDPEDIGEKTARLKMGHEEAIEYVRKVCEKNGFGILVEFSPSEVLNKKVGADKDPYYVLGACNAKVADKALDITMKIGGLFPCNMVIWEQEPGVQTVYHISIMKAARSLGIAPDNEEWQEIIDETGKNVEAVFEELNSRS